MGRASGPSTRRPGPPPRCADGGAPTRSRVTLPGAVGPNDWRPPEVTRSDRSDGRARRRIVGRHQRVSSQRVWWTLLLGSLCPELPPSFFAAYPFTIGGL